MVETEILIKVGTTVLFKDRKPLHLRGHYSIYHNTEAEVIEIVKRNDLIISFWLKFPDGKEFVAQAEEVFFVKRSSELLGAS